MAQTKVINLEVQTNAKSLKAQLREAQQEVQVLSDKFGVTSKEAVTAAKKAAELKDAIGDAKALTDAFNPDAKFNALSSSIGGVLNGFQAFEGALGLVGVESKAVQEQLLKVQSAMALTEGINGIMAAKDSFKVLAGVIKTNLVSAFSTLKGAILTTGIGALVIAIGLLLPKIMDWIDATKEIDAANKKFNDTLDKQTAIIDRQSKQLRERQKTELEMAKARGTSEKDLLNLEKEQLSERDKLSQKSLKNITDAIKQKTGAYKWALKEEEWELAKKIQVEIQALVKQKQDIVDLKRSEHTELAVQQTQFFYDTKAKREEDLKDAKDKAREKSKAEREAKAKADKESQDAEDSFLSRGQKMRESNLENYAKNRATELDIDNDAYQIRKDLRDKALLEEKQRQDKELEDHKTLQQAKYDTARNTFALVGNLATLFAGKSEKEQKRAFEITKAANIAQTLMETYKSATAAFSSMAGIPYVGPVLGGIAAAGAVAAGLVNVKSISQQQFGGGATGGGAPNPSMGSTPSPQVITPNFNIIGNQNQTQLAQLQQAPIKAYVVGSDVTTQQMLDKKKVQNATL